MIFSPLETADFLMLLKPSGDGYSLLCSKKQPPRHTYYATNLMLHLEIVLELAYLFLFILAETEICR